MSCAERTLHTPNLQNPLVPYDNYTSPDEDHAGRPDAITTKDIYAALKTGFSREDGGYFADPKHHVLVAAAGQATALVPQPSPSGVAIQKSAPRLVDGQSTTSGRASSGSPSGGQLPDGSNDNRWWKPWLRNSAKVAKYFVGGVVGLVLFSTSSTTFGDGEIPRLANGPVRPLEVVRIAGSGALLRRPDGSVFYSDDPDLLESLGIEVAPKSAVPNQSFSTVTPRPLGDYFARFGSGFMRILDGLGEDERWLDAGAGRAVAISEFLAEYAKGNAVALAFAVPTSDPRALASYVSMVASHGDRVSLLFGRLLEDISAEELGSFRVVTDVFGPATYSTDLKAVIERYGQVVSSGDQIFVSLGKGSLSFEGHLSTEAGLRDWLEGQGFYVSSLGSGDASEEFVLTRSDQPLTVPELDIRVDDNATSTTYPLRIATIVRAPTMPDDQATVASGPGSEPRIAVEDSLHPITLEAIKDNSFRTHRRWVGNEEHPGYLDSFGDALVDELASFDDNDRFLDSGTGEGLAVSGFLSNPSQRGRAVGLAYAPVQGIDAVYSTLEDAYGDRAQFYFGEFLENYSVEQLGTFRVIADMIGPMTYSPDSVAVLRKYGELLEPGGKLFIRVGRRAFRLASSTSTEDWWTAKLTEGPLREWLDGSGLRVEQAPPDDIDPVEGFEQDMVVVLTRTDDPLSIPPLDPIAPPTTLPNPNPYPYRVYRVPTPRQNHRRDGDTSWTSRLQRLWTAIRPW